jgi:hypothetical protein
MVCDFTAVVDVYLCHTFSAMLELSSYLTAVYEAIRWPALQRCIAACGIVLDYVRFARSICGVLGLLAIDRSMEHLRVCINSWIECRKYHPGRTLYSVAGLCYASALNRQCHSDVQLRDLWLHAGSFADNAASQQTNDLNCEFRNGTKNAKALVAQAVSFDARRIEAARSKQAWTAKFNEDAARFCRLEMVSTIICDIYVSGWRSLPSTARSTFNLMMHQCHATKLARELIVRNIKVWSTADGPHCVEIQSLAETAASRLGEAVTLVIASPTDGLEGQSSENDKVLVQKKRVAAVLEHNAFCLATLACALSPVASQVVAPRIIWDHVLHLLAELTRSAKYADSDTVHVREFDRLSETIRHVARGLKEFKFTTPNANVAIQHCLIEAGKVPRNSSPAHPYIADCWVQAARFTKLSVEARAVGSAAQDTQHLATLHTCWVLCEKLATGIFQEAAEYYQTAKSDASPHTRQLWQEAAELLVQVGVSQMRRVDEAAASPQLHSTELGLQTAREAALSRCAAACAACAVCADNMAGAMKSEGATTGATHQTSSPIELSALGDGDDRNSADSVNYADVDLKMRLLLVRLERTALLRAVRRHCVSAVEESLLGKLRGVVKGIQLLSGTCNQATSSPTGQRAGKPVPFTEGLQHLNRLLRWLCDSVESCYLLTQRALEAQTQQLTPAGNCEKARKDLVAALDLVDGIQRYANTAEHVHNHRYRVRSYKQAERNQVLCKLCLTAARSALTGQFLARALLVRAQELQLNGMHAGMINLASVATGNTLICKAWLLLPDTDGCPPSHLLQSLPPEILSAQSAKDVQVKADAHLQYITHQVALGQASSLLPREVVLRRRAMEYCRCVIVRDLTPDSVLCVRAMQSTSWCALAVEALRDGNEDVTALYEQAVQFGVLPSGVGNGAYPEKAQRVCHSAGVRFAAAALALAAGDQQLYRRWLQAAEATAKLVVVTPLKPEGHGRQQLLVSTTNANIEAADQLEARALALQVRRQRETGSGQVLPCGPKAGCCVIV